MNTYAIVNITELDNINYNDIIGDKETMRISIDGLKFIIEWEGDKPVSLSGIDMIEYTYEEILEVVEGINWRENNLE